MKNLTQLIIAIALLGLLPVTGKDVETAMGTSSATVKKPSTSISQAKLKPKKKRATQSKTEAKKMSTAKTKTKPAGVQKHTKAVLSSAEERKLLSLLNEGTADEVSAIQGIAGTRAKSIVSARPFQNIYEVILIPGIGDATFEQILAHGKKLPLPVAKSVKS